MPDFPTRTSQCPGSTDQLQTGTDSIRRTKHCWQNYVDYHKCILAKGEDFAPCRQVRTALSVRYLCRDQMCLPEIGSSSSHIDLSAQVLGVSGGMSSEVSTADTRILQSIAERTFFRERHLSYSSGPVMGSQPRS